MGTVQKLTDAEQEFCDRYLHREYNARRALHAAGLKLERNDPDHWTHRTFGRLYHIRRGSQVIEGAGQVEYEMTLEQVENYIKQTTDTVVHTTREIIVFRVLQTVSDVCDDLAHCADLQGFTAAFEKAFDAAVDAFPEIAEALDVRSCVMFTVEEMADMAQSLIELADGMADANAVRCNKELSDEIGCAGAILKKLLADGVITEPVTLPGAAAS